MCISGYHSQSHQLTESAPYNHTHPDHVCRAAETHTQIFIHASSPITVALEVKPQLEDVIVKLTAKASLV